MTIIGIVLILLGCLIFVGSMGSKNFDFSMLSSEKFEQKTYTTEEAFQSICIDEDYGVDIKLLPSTDGICKIEYPESKNVLCEISVENGTLKIKQTDNRRWYQMIGFFFNIPTLTVYLPASEGQTLNLEASTSDVTIPADLSFENLKIRLSTGNVTVSANVTENLEIEVSTGNVKVSDCAPASVSLTTTTGRIEATTIHATGDVYVQSSTGRQILNDVTCVNATLISLTGDKEISALTVSETLTAESGTGDQSYTDVTCTSANLRASTGYVKMANLIASGHLRVETTTGSISFDRCDAASINVTTDTGAVTGTFRTPKIILAHSDTGKVDVPRSTEGGICEITTDTGRISISYAE